MRYGNCHCIISVRTSMMNLRNDFITRADFVKHFTTRPGAGGFMRVR
jgi:hypothetical protein